MLSRYNDLYLSEPEYEEVETTMANDVLFDELAGKVWEAEGVLPVGDGSQEREIPAADGRR